MNLSVFLSAAALIMSPGGHGSLAANGVLYAESGHAGGLSSVMYARTRVRGLRVRVWEDGSFRVKRGKRVVFTGCLVGKGCED